MFYNVWFCVFVSVCFVSFGPNYLKPKRNVKLLLFYLSCLVVWDVVEMFHAMIPKIFWCSDEVALISFLVAPRSQCTIHFASDFEAVYQVNLRFVMLVCGGYDLMYWLMHKLPFLPFFCSSRNCSHQCFRFGFCYADAASPGDWSSSDLPNLGSMENMFAPMFLDDQCHSWHLPLLPVMCF